MHFCLKNIYLFHPLKIQINTIIKLGLVMLNTIIVIKQICFYYFIESTSFN